MAANSLSVTIKLVDDISAKMGLLQKQVNGFGGALDSAGKKSSTSSSSFTKTSSTLNSLSSAAAKTTGVLVALGAAIGIKVAKDAITSAINIEQLGTSFEVMLGSAEKAKAMMQDITTFAASTPFELTGVQTASKSLLAFGLEQEKILPSLKNIGDIAAGVNVPLEELAQIYGKARTAGRLYAEDVNQLTERGIPIIKELAKQFNVSEGEVKKLVEEGKVGFPELEKAFASMSGEGGQFFNLMEKQSKTAGGVISNLKDTMFALGLAIVGVGTDGTIQPGGAFDQFKTTLQNISTYISENKDKIVAFATAIGTNVVSALTTLASIGSTAFAGIKSVIEFLLANQWVLAAVGGAIAGVLVPAFIAWGVSAAAAAASTLLALAPFIIVGAAIGVFVYQIIKNWDRIKLGTQVLWNGVKGMFKAGVAFLKSIWTVATSFLKSSWANLVGGIKNMASSFWNFIKNGIKGMWDAVRNAFSSAGNFVKGIFTSFVESIKSKFTSLMDKFKTAKEIISNAFEQMVNRAREKWQQMIAAIGEKISNIIQKMQELKDKIIEKITSIDLKSIGSNMMMGLAEGIASKIPFIGEKAAEAVRAAKSSAEAEGQIQSPSKVFEKIGGFMSEGMAIGLMGGKNKIQSAVSQMTYKRSPEKMVRDAQTNNNTTANTTNNNTNKNISFNITQRNGETPQEIADAILLKMKSL